MLHCDNSNEQFKAEIEEKKYLKYKLKAYQNLHYKNGTVKKVELLLIIKLFDKRC